MSKWITGSAIVLGWLVLAVHVSAAEPLESPQAQALFSEGLQLFQQKDYVDAIDRLTKAYDLEPSPRILFALSQASRLNGDCESATKYGQLFLDSHPPENVAKVIRLNIFRCTARRVAPEAAALAPVRPMVQLASPVAEAAPSVTVVQPRSPPRRHKWWVWGAPLLSVAGAGLAVGLGLGFGLNRQSAAPNTHFGGIRF